jgi:hypothetical protein
MTDDVRPWDLINPNQPKSSDELINSRLEICRSCNWFRHSTEQCKKCGCFMKLKTRLVNANCPLGKW